MPKKPYTIHTPPPPHPDFFLISALFFPPPPPTLASFSLLRYTRQAPTSVFAVAVPSKPKSTPHPDIHMTHSVVSKPLHKCHLLSKLLLTTPPKLELSPPTQLSLGLLILLTALLDFSPCIYYSLAYCIYSFIFPHYNIRSAKITMCLFCPSSISST